MFRSYLPYSPHPPSRCYRYMCTILECTHRSSWSDMDQILNHIRQYWTCFTPTFRTVHARHTVVTDTSVWPWSIHTSRVGLIWIKYCITFVNTEHVSLLPSVQSTPAIPLSQIHLYDPEVFTQVELAWYGSNIVSHSSILNMFHSYLPYSPRPPYRCHRYICMTLKYSHKSSWPDMDQILYHIRQYWTCFTPTFRTVHARHTVVTDTSVWPWSIHTSRVGLIWIKYCITFVNTEHVSLLPSVQSTPAIPLSQIHLYDPWVFTQIESAWHGPNSVSHSSILNIVYWTCFTPTFHTLHTRHTVVTDTSVWSLSVHTSRISMAWTRCWFTFVLPSIHSTPAIPLSQIHLYDPWVFIQVELAWHGLGVDSHSSMSLKRNQNHGVFVKHYAPAATKSKKLFLASRSQSSPQGHWPWCHFKGRH